MFKLLLLSLLVVSVAIAAERNSGKRKNRQPPGQFGDPRGGQPSEYRFGQVELSILKKIYESEPETSFTFSPFSIRTLLAMVLEGTNGQTRSDLAAALGETRGLRRVVRDNSGFRVGNAFYLSNTLNINEKFKDKLVSEYGAEFQYADFVRPRSAAYNVNEWVRRVTDKGIKELISPDSLSPETVFMMVNAIFLKARWDKTFDSEETVPNGIFHENHQGSLKPKMVDMMKNYEYFRYGIIDSLNARVVELPFQDPKRYSMYIVLPHDPKGLSNLINSLTAESFNEIIKSMNHPVQMTLYLPKFSAETTQQLNDILPTNVAQVFGPNADITGITADSKVQLSKVLHKANLKVDEEGATGTAATAVHAILLSNAPQIEFNVSHPFMYFIAEKVQDNRYYSQPSSEVIFMGYVSKLEDSRELPSSWGPLPDKPVFQRIQRHRPRN
ncbi:Hypothetical predicted protein [Cloeon dipterum]|uniref:Serpin domain-containing protein n=1 Tax=Cloeon dipterum TaxID=197152 RepID=A0A8S1D8A4_9INSE|nr:Hypothetical predicted protein [Cloeon dipterum]